MKTSNLTHGQPYAGLSDRDAAITEHSGYQALQAYFAARRRERIMNGLWWLASACVMAWFITVIFGAGAAWMVAVLQPIANR